MESERSWTIYGREATTTRKIWEQRKEIGEMKETHKKKATVLQLMKLCQREREISTLALDKFNAFPVASHTVELRVIAHTEAAARTSEICVTFTTHWYSIEFKFPVESERESFAQTLKITRER